MAADIEYYSKTQRYLKVKKPLVERQRRARINKCLEALKVLVAELQGDAAILRMDTAEMLEATTTFVRTRSAAAPSADSMDSFRHGYINAVGEVSRFMASAPGMNVDVGKAVMRRLGCQFYRMLQKDKNPPAAEGRTRMRPLYTEASSSSAAPASPASSGYHSDCGGSPMASPVQDKPASVPAAVWRPW